MRISVSINEDHHGYSGEVTVPGDDRLEEMGIAPGEPLALVEWAEEILQGVLDGRYALTFIQ